MLKCKKKQQRCFLLKGDEAPRERQFNMSKKTRFFGYILIAILLLAIGVLFIAFNNSLKILTICVGVILALFGIVFGIVAIAGKDRGFTFVMKIILAVICLGCGVVTAILNEKAAEILAALFALLLIVDGSFKLNTSAMSKRYGVRLWWIMLIPAVLLISGGFGLIKYAPQSSGAMSVILGVLIIIDAIINFASVFYVPVYERHMKEDILAEAELDEE